MSPKFWTQDRWAPGVNSRELKTMSKALALVVLFETRRTVRRQGVFRSNFFDQLQDSWGSERVYSWRH